MTAPIAWVADSAAVFAALHERLAEGNGAGVIPPVVSLERAKTSIASFAGPVVVVLDVGGNPERAFRLAEEIKLELPEARLVMTAADGGPDTILRAMRAGAEEFVRQPIDADEIQQCLTRVRQRIAVRGGNGRPLGRVLAVFAAHGGAGCTTVATNLGVLLSARSHAVCIVDLVLQFGAVTSFLDLEGSFTLPDFATSLSRIDRLILDGALALDPSGARVLGEPAPFEEASRVSGSEVRAVLETLQGAFDFVIADLPKHVDSTCLPALERAERILLLTEPSVPSLRRTRRALDAFETLGIPARKVLLVVNRHVRGRSMGIEALERTLGMRVFRRLPEDERTANAASNQGISLSRVRRGAPLTREVEALAAALLAELGMDAKAQRPPAGALRRWFGAVLPLSSAPGGI